jgi:hypothetical protein
MGAVILQKEYPDKASRGLKEVVREKGIDADDL